MISRREIQTHSNCRLRPIGETEPNGAAFSTIGILDIPVSQGIMNFISDLQERNWAKIKSEGTPDFPL